MMAPEHPTPTTRTVVTVDGKRHILLTPDTLAALSAETRTNVEAHPSSEYATLRFDSVRFAALIGGAS